MVTRNSFAYAINGLKYVLAKERNARFHFFAATFVLVLALIFNLYLPDMALGAGEFASLILAIILVFISEIINTAVERLADFYPKKNRPRDIDKSVEVVKDIMAGAVLVSAVGAMTIGATIFLPRILFLIRGL